MDREVSYAKSGDVSIAYTTVGEGPADLVFVPGFVSHLDVQLSYPAIARMVARVSQFARVIAFDKRGTGLSDPVAGAPSVEECLDDLEAVLGAAGAGTVDLLGISEGSTISALFAARNPDRTRKLILYGSYAKGIAGPDYPWAPTPEQIDLAGQMIDRDWGHGVFHEIQAPSRADDPEFIAWWARFQRLAASPAMAKAVTRLASEIDIRNELPNVSAPTLVLHRKGDLLWPIEGARFVSGQIPGAKLVELEGEDHFPFTGETDTMLGEIEEFLTGSRQAADAERQLLTVMFSDIVDSTALASRLGDRAWREMLDTHDDLVRTRIRLGGGREVKTTGDGFLATFTSPARAIECARRVTEATAAQGIDVRIGLHTGECEVRGDDVAGLAVHIAARVAALAEGGEVLVSDTVRGLVVGSPISFESRGSHELKGVPGVWEIFAVSD